MLRRACIKINMNKDSQTKKIISWWEPDIEEIARKLGADTGVGISHEEAKKRLLEFGPNQLEEKKGPSALSIFLEQFSDFIIWVLIGAALVSGFLKEWIDAAAIIGIVIINAILGFIQEYRAEKSLAALKKLTSPTSKVMRGGERVVVPSSQIVSGDVIELEAGDNVPGDSRLFWITGNFTVNEASLTGESTPVSKGTDVLAGADIGLADRANMVFMGTSIAYGKAKALVVETGMNTELGKIAGMIEGINSLDTPLQRKLEEFGKWIVYLCFALVGLVFVLGLWRGGKLIDMFLTAVSLAVAAIPEGLPAVVTIALALGVQRMAKRHALIRKLPSVETLGSATVICSDKTGTLTKNEMTVKTVATVSYPFEVTGIGYDKNGEFLIDNKSFDIGNYPDLKKCLVCGCLCNGAEFVPAEKRIIGDPTEAAILVSAAKAGFDKKYLEKEYEFVEEIPFDSERKMMTMARRHNGKNFIFVKGAPDVLLSNCTSVEDRGLARLMTESDIKKINSINNDLALKAMRVLAVAYRELDCLPSKLEAADLERDLIFSGLIAMIDPARPEVKEAIEKCKAAGIRTVMITGDHKNTAIAIAKELGFFNEDSKALSGEELDRISDAELSEIVGKVTVYGRVSPEHKLRIVRRLRHHGEIVAMTGDGVNDAPAVKEADIGVAMGITGTDVTKEVSDMVITDDNFASIVAAVEEGRGIYDNIKKFIHYLLSCNAGEILVMLVSTLMGLPVPLLPVQILWVNLITDGLPALALGVDPVNPDVMRRPPRSPDEKVVTRKRAVLMLVQGVFIAACSLLAFCFVLEKEGLGRARTAAFVVLSCTQLFHAFNCRSMSESIFKLGIFTNKKLVAAALISFFLQMVVVYIPFLQVIFKTQALGVFDWLLVVMISSLPLWAMEIAKLINKKAHFLDNV